MKFEINHNEWKIILQDKQTLIDKYNSENEESNFVFGVTLYAKHEIWINKDMCVDQQIRTLKHELTHCYMWNYGLYNVPNFNEEMVCDLVSSINDFINEVVEQFKEYYKTPIKMKEITNPTFNIEKAFRNNKENELEYRKV